MDRSLLYIIIYAICVLATFICYLIKTKRILSISSIILIWWSLSAISSCFFYFFFQPVLNEFSFFPIIYYLVGFFIIIYTVLVFDENKIDIIIVKGHQSIIGYFIYLIGIISIPPLIENVIYLISHGGSLDFIEDGHAALNSGDFDSHLSFLSQKMISFSSHFIDLLGLFLFLLFSRKKINRVQVSFVLLAIFSQILDNLSKGSRGYIVYVTIIILISYILFYKHILKKRRILINKLVATVIILFSLILYVMTNVRFKEMNVSYLNASEDQALLVSNSLYLGEAPVRFACYAWDIKSHTNGHSLFHNIVSLIDGVKFENSVERRDWTALKTGLEYPQVFYGLTGYAFIDFGLYGGFLFLVFFSFILYRIMKLSRKMYFHDLILVIICLKIIFFSTIIFPYNYSKLSDLIYMLILYFILKFK